jgi:hypothetical protein
MDPQEFQKRGQEEGRKSSYYHDLQEKEKGNSRKSSRNNALLSLLFLFVLIIALWLIFFSGAEQIEGIEHSLTNKTQVHGWTCVYFG